VETSPLLADLLRSQLCGASLAAALLIPMPSAAHGVPSESVASIQVDGSPVLVIRSFLINGPQPLLTTPDVSAEPPANDAVRLRQIAQLPVTALARVLGVSRQAYHEWTRGGNIAVEHQGRLKRMLTAVERIAEQRQDVRTFLVTATELGQPIQLVANGREAEAIGLSLRSATVMRVGPRGPIVDIQRRIRSNPGRRAEAEQRESMIVAFREPMSADERANDQFESIGSFEIG
jgi:hypothetical protein